MNSLLSLSNDLAGAVERAGRAVVAVNGRPRLPSTGVHWRPGVIVTADHTLRADEDITITRADGWVYVPPESEGFPAGARVEMRALP